MIFEVLGLSIVAEVGIGGRLDVITTIPDDDAAVSALTSVELDRQGSLRNAVAGILLERWGLRGKGSCSCWG